MRISKQIRRFNTGSTFLVLYINTRKFGIYNKKISFKIVFWSWSNNLLRYSIK